MRFNNVKYRVIGGSKGSAVRLALSNLASNHRVVFVDAEKEKENSWIIEIVYENVGEEEDIPPTKIGVRL